MQTLYLDVYFLINFTVDILAIYFAVSFSAVPTSRIRLVLGAVMGAVFATIAIFLENPFLKLISAVVFSLIIALVSVRGAGVARRMKFFFAFLVFETLIGGAVYFGYSLLDKYMYELLKSQEATPENRSLLIVSIVILLSVGVFKLFLSVFTSERRRKNAEIEIIALGKRVRFGAFVDSGNLLRDPIDNRPIMLIKTSLARRLLPPNLIFGKPEELSYNEKRRLRLIPVTSGDEVKILTGIKPDEVRIIKEDGKTEEIEVILAIDKEGGTYGGYEALIPPAAIEDVT